MRIDKLKSGFVLLISLIFLISLVGYPENLRRRLGSAFSVLSRGSSSELTNSRTQGTTLTFIDPTGRV
jgi:hypothetical protein